MIALETSNLPLGHQREFVTFGPATTYRRRGGRRGGRGSRRGSKIDGTTPLYLDRNSLYSKLKDPPQESGSAGHRRKGKLSPHRMKPRPENQSRSINQ